MNLLRNIDIIKASTARVVAGATMHSKVVDMQGFEGCLFIAVGSTLLEGTSGGSSAVNKKVVMYVKSSTASAGTYVKHTAYCASSSGLAGGVNNRVLALDVYKPTDRYLKAAIHGASSGGIDAIMALRYSARRPGSSALQNSTTVVASTVVASPTTA